MESTTNQIEMTKKGTFPANVASVLPNKCQLVINKGKKDGIRFGQRMLVYSLSEEEIKDPNTGESLGCLEIVKGTGKIINIQDKISTLESDKIQSKSIMTPVDIDSAGRIILFAGRGEQRIEETYIVPFENPQIGDLVKPIQ